MTNPRAAVDPIMPSSVARTICDRLVNGQSLGAICSDPPSNVR